MGEQTPVQGEAEAKFEELRALWTSMPDTLAYLIKLDDRQAAALLALPGQMRARELEAGSAA